MRRLALIGSDRLYPKRPGAPLCEGDILSGPLDPGDEAIALAGIAGLKMCEYHNRQYGTRIVAVLESGVYGPGDNFHPGASRILPCMLHRLHEARERRLPAVTFDCICGSRRDFLHVDDLAAACAYLLTLPDDLLRPVLDGGCCFNAAGGRMVTMFELALAAAAIVGYDGRLIFEPARCCDPASRLLDASRLGGLGWSPRVGLAEGVRGTYAWYVENAPHVFWL